LPAGVLLLATLGAEPVGCGAVKLHPGGPAEIVRVWVSADVRGLVPAAVAAAIEREGLYAPTPC